MAGFSNETMYADNVNFSGAKSPAVTLNGQLMIGSTVAPNIRIGTLTSSNSSITITNGAGTIDLTVGAGSGAILTLTGNTGGARSPTAGNINTFGAGSITIVGSGSTLTTQLTGLTNHAVLVGAGTDTITKVGPTATAGQVLQSAGASADPAFSTATFPSTATGTGTILRADGTNWVATTATYPNTVAAGKLLFATTANVVAAASFSIVVQTFTADGTYTPTTGMQACIIRVTGGGGGGGGAATTGASQISLGAGGGAGGTATSAFSAATIGASQSVSIGAAGTAGGNTGTSGGNGGTTSVGALISATGGTGGGSSGAAASSAVAQGGAGGAGTGQEAYVGGAGWDAIGFNIPTVALVGMAGAGGDTQDAGKGGAAQYLLANASGGGIAGVFGGGGSGAFSSATGSGATGGAGGPGEVTIFEYVIV